MKKILKRTLFGLLIINLLLGGRACYYDTEIKDLDETARTEYLGDYIQTNQGWTRYKFTQGDSLNAPIVLFIGGLTTDGVDYFDAVAQQFAKEGFSTLQFDLFGRGGSERLTDADYGRQTYIQQIDDLLYALDIHQPINIIGQSLGGSIAVAWASQNTNRTKSLSIHASAGHIEGQEFMNALLETPILGKYIFWLFKDKITTGRVAQYFDKQEDDTERIHRINENIKKAAQFNGYYNAVYRTIINYDAHNLETEFKILGKSDVPVQIIWGKSDKIIPIENVKVLNSWLRKNTELVVYENVGHMPLAENPTKTTADVLNFIKSKESIAKQTLKVIRKDDKIMIVGAAIGGLSTALALSQKGFTNITIIDKAATHESTAPLVPINLGANAVRVFGHLGLKEKLLERSYIWHQAKIITSKNTELGFLDAKGIHEEYGSPLLTTSRRHMQNTLLEGLSNVEIIRGIGVQSYQQIGDSVFVYLDNGEQQTASLLIGADGNKSITRDYVMGETELISDGNISIQALISRNQLTAPNHIGLVESFTEVVSSLGSVGFGLNSEDTANIFFNVPLDLVPNPRDTEAILALVRARFADFPAPIPDLLNALQKEDLVCYYPADKVLQSGWSKGNVTLVSDAAHPCLQYTGQGSAMGMEGAMILATSLDRSVKNGQALVNALATYEMRHMPRVKIIHSESRKLGKVFGLTNPLVVGLRNVIMPIVPKEISTASIIKIHSEKASYD